MVPEPLTLLPRVPPIVIPPPVRLPVGLPVLLLAFPVVAALTLAEELLADCVLPTTPEPLLVALMELGVALVVPEVVFESRFSDVVLPPEAASSEQARAKDPNSARPPTNEMSFCDDMGILQASMVLPTANASRAMES